MTRFETPGDPIRVAYGCDDVTGVFLSVMDKRLKFDSGATEAVNRVTEAIGTHDGGGSCFDLHRGQRGFGVKVDDATMATYLRRFGVPEEKIAGLPLKNARNCTLKYCLACSGGPQRCSRCSLVTYCSRACQQNDWPIHKLFCPLASTHLSFPTKRAFRYLFYLRTARTHLLFVCRMAGALPRR